jgi:hypothetical protein
MRKALVIRAFCVELRLPPSWLEQRMEQHPLGPAFRE